ncbi:type 1 glutamine amidotransferase domain-containing protein [Corynebacterium sp. TA-R-1]|uniref:Type 1 glutamine amidotransferase domain-containing protein n=1 Tax=Corynebacterium stercoris TaxID=2943490 RepID=A0ABT1FZZ4_9CORY|nr:type 1 glutamine amidotransferase domain-containing protein [Corynebacterium stercoris]MCP1387342.1 type 1 glutamine amidotransferase domain-containing protein [Corynebacterium stercoris]
MKILAVSTSVHRYATSGIRTGMWLGEFTHFYDVLTEAGHEVDLASVAGGVVPIDPVSLKTPVIQMGGTNKRYEDPEFMSLLDDTPAIANVDLDAYDGIFLNGGHGTMYDFDSADLSRAVAHFADAGKVVSAVCHGPCGLLGVTLADGTSLLSGLKVTGYSWAEEKLAMRADEVPFSLEDKLKAEAGEYSTATVPMTKHVVVDGTLVTGQNPMSASGVGEAVVEQLER